MKLKNILFTSAVILAVGTGAMYDSHLENIPILPEAFDKSKWVKIYSDGEIHLKNYFMQENIPHGDKNLELYLQKVKSRNNGKTRGYLEVPNLDKNGWPERDPYAPL